MKAVKSLIKRALRRRGYRLVRTWDSNALECLLSAVLARKPLTFVQIGANDGRTNDPLFEFVTFHHERVRGLVVEPVEDYFAELVENYRPFPHITPVRAAIHRTEKEMTIYRVDPVQQRANPRLRKGIASFNPDHHRRSHVPTEAIIAQKVPCMTLGELLRRHGLGQLDLLLIDAEGYDAEIVRSVDFSANPPSIVRFEHGRLGSTPRETFFELREMLRGHGYDLIIEPSDAIAYRPEVMLAR